MGSRPNRLNCTTAVIETTEVGIERSTHPTYKITSTLSTSARVQKESTQFQQINSISTSEKMKLFTEKPYQQNINNTIQHYNSTVIKVYSNEDSMKHFQITTWINAIGLIIVVVALLSFFIRKQRLSGTTLVRSVLYRTNEQGSME